MSVGMNDKALDYVADFFNGSRVQLDVLYDGAKVTLGAIDTTSTGHRAIDYDVIALISKTNVEYFIDYAFLGSPFYLGQEFCFSHTIYPPSESIYNSYYYYSIDSTGYKINIDARSNNSNWKLGVIKVIGIKFMGGAELARKLLEERRGVA